MDGSDQQRENGRELARALDVAGGDLVCLARREARLRRAEAYEHIAKYAAKLRDRPVASPSPTRSAAARNARSFLFKIEHPDGRWSVREKELAVMPALGTALSFDCDRTLWRVRRVDLVLPQPTRKPARLCFVCEVG